MTILKQIRNKNYILLILLGLSIVGFLFNFDQCSNFFSSNPNIYGQVNGENISKQEFVMLKQLINSQLETPISEAKIWDHLIYKKLIGQQFNKLGIELTEKNFWKFIKYSSIFSSNFQENTNFNFIQLKKQIEELRKKSSIDSKSLILYENWLEQKKLIEYEIQKKLYLSTLLRGLFINQKEKDFIQEYIDKKIKIDFILINYEDYNKKNRIIINNQDLKQYIKSQENQSNINPSVLLKYVKFQNIPTIEDDMITYKEMQTYIKGGNILDESGKIIDSVKSFKTININEAQSYINSYSDQKSHPEYYTAEQQPKPIHNWIKNSPIGSIFGPYLFDNYYIVSKLLDTKLIDSISARHILISYKKLFNNSKRTKKQAKKLSDSILVEVSKNPNNFTKLVSLSDDIISLQKGGQIKSITGQENLSPELQKFLENNNKGKVGVVKTKFGYHVINILDKKMINKLYCIGHLMKKRKPSQKTSNKITNQAINFFQNILNKPEKEFANIAEKLNLKVTTLNQTSKQLFTLDEIDIDDKKNKEILRWVFHSKRKIGDTNIFTTSNQDHIVVIINSINLNNTKTTIETIDTKTKFLIRNQKIAKLLIKKINTSHKSLDQLAKDFSTIKQSSIVDLNNLNIQNIGIEPSVIGTAFGIYPNIQSKAIEGKTGVFVIRTNKIMKNTHKNKNDRIITEKKYIEKTRRLGYQEILLGLKNISDIKDLRSIED